eukprot:734831-Prorocentrum_minimum.AAC.1
MGRESFANGSVPPRARASLLARFRILLPLPPDPAPPPSGSCSPSLRILLSPLSRAASMSLCGARERAPASERSCFQCCLSGRDSGFLDQIAGSGFLDQDFWRFSGVSGFPKFFWRFVLETSGNDSGWRRMTRQAGRGGGLRGAPPATK